MAGTKRRPRPGERCAVAQQIRLAPRSHAPEIGELALSLLRYTDRTKEVEKLLGGVHQHECSEIFVNGLHYAQGLLLGKQGQFALAINQLQQVLIGFRNFNHPLIRAMQAEISGYLAVFLYQIGEKDKSWEIWNQVSPRLTALQAEHVLALYQH